MIILRRATLYTVLILSLVGCSQPEPTPAPISSVGQHLTKEQQDRIVYNRSYDAIPKGSYNGESYRVQHGDTLFYIAWISGNDFRELAQRNNISPPYQLQVGQTIKLSNDYTAGSQAKQGSVITASDGLPRPPSASQMQGSTVDNRSANTYHDGARGKPLQASTPVVAGSAAAPITAPKAVPSVSKTANSQPAASNNAPVKGWKWPTNGKVIDNFSLSEGGNKGIDIAGSRGQAIFATADGRVVYAGNALRGYGNLIIIKHNDDYLSAYAHNETMLVREQQDVKAGQKIATMGNTGTSSTRLHFEIRYKGKSVNPLRYLPQR
ncbi:murein hydrolase activator NlpD [Serratia microhaemolytica]|uniref:murein hydrolase activator NlpD n=1 Tax=Serratia microhaemolytica TaxID=2675110 RepID=UPI000FDD29B9|nr:murein hydrolase activator NlpD [Serratia microhaemolytica]